MKKLRDYQVIEALKKYKAYKKFVRNTDEGYIDRCIKNNNSADTLLYGFVWNTSPEGLEYWRNIIPKVLKAIEDDKR